MVCEEFVETEGSVEVEPRPAAVLEVALVLSLGFFGALGPSLGARGALLSFITIFAWISSSFAALTFLGQKSVTNLGMNKVFRSLRVHGIALSTQYSRPKMSTPSISVLSSCRLLTEHILYPLAYGSQGLF